MIGAGFWGYEWWNKDDEWWNKDDEWWNKDDGRGQFGKVSQMSQKELEHAGRPPLAHRKPRHLHELDLHLQDYYYNNPEFAKQQGIII